MRVHGVFVPRDVRSALRSGPVLWPRWRGCVFSAPPVSQRRVAPRSCGQRAARKGKCVFGATGSMIQRAVVLLLLAAFYGQRARQARRLLTPKRRAIVAWALLARRSCAAWAPLERRLGAAWSPLGRCSGPGVCTDARSMSRGTLQCGSRVALRRHTAGLAGSRALLDCDVSALLPGFRGFACAFDPGVELYVFAVPWRAACDAMQHPNGVQRRRTLEGPPQVCSSQTRSLEHCESSSSARTMFRSPRSAQGLYSEGQKCERAPQR